MPATEAHGRLHTSTMSVAVLPQPRDIEVVLNTNDIKTDTFRATGYVLLFNKWYNLYSV